MHVKITTIKYEKLTPKDLIDIGELILLAEYIMNEYTTKLFWV
jgi:hypothetical protein